MKGTAMGRKFLGRRGVTNPPSFQNSDFVSPRKTIRTRKEEDHRHKRAAVYTEEDEDVYLDEEEEEDRIYWDEVDLDELYMYLDATAEKEEEYGVVETIATFSSVDNDDKGNKKKKRLSDIVSRTSPTKRVRLKPKSTRAFVNEFKLVHHTNTSESISLSWNCSSEIDEEIRDNGILPMDFLFESKYSSY